MRISISPNSDNIQGRTAEKTMALQNRRRMKGLPPHMRLLQASVRVLQVFGHADALNLNFFAVPSCRPSILTLYQNEKTGAARCAFIVVNIRCDDFINFVQQAQLFHTRAEASSAARAVISMHHPAMAHASPESAPGTDFRYILG